MKYKIGLVLSGGGVRAVAHIGFIQFLLENGIVPTIISGTSGGAIVGALYAAGYTTEEMLSFFKKTPLLKIGLYARGKPGFMDSEKYTLYFKNYFREDTFKHLKYPLIVTATNLINGNLDYFDKGKLISALIASSSLPPIFSPIEINGDLYCDGGVLNNFPVEPLYNKCEIIMGSFVNPIHSIEKSDINSMYKLITRVFHIALDVNNFKKFNMCNYVFLPTNLKEIGILDAKSIEKAYKLGYVFAKKEKNKILHSLNL